MWEPFGEAAWRVTLAGLVFGAGLPALYAVGVRWTELGSGGDTGTDAASSVPSRVRRVLGIVCFALVLIAVAMGLLIIVASGLDKEISFEHVYPTLVPKG